MYLTGFADEAGADIDTQIRATRELGWNHIESRNIDGVNIHDMSEQDFERAVEKLETAGVKINCFGSAIANWAKPITDPFEITQDEIERAIPRMQRLGTGLIRMMSYAVLKDEQGHALVDQMKEERFRRVREIVAQFSDAGILPVHENCMNYGGMSYQNTLDLVENVPGLKLVFDTGNPVFTDDSSKAPLSLKQSAWEFYSAVKDHIAYIHIKDGVWDAEKKNMDYRYPGEGSGDVCRILKDLLGGGYDGGISIEPHLGAVFHDQSVQSDDEKKYKMYVEYGRRVEQILRDVAAK